MSADPTHGENGHRDDPMGWTLEVIGDEREAGAPVHRYPLMAGERVVGSGPEADLRLTAPGVSRRHALLEVLPDGGALLTDLGSKNGTFVDGRRVRRAALAPGARLAFGPVTAAFAAADPGRDGIAIHRSPPDGTEDEVETGPGEEPTRGTAPVERVVAALRDAVTAGVESPGAAAVTLVEAWFGCLPLVALSVLAVPPRDEGDDEPVVLAQAGGEPETEAPLAVTAPGGGIALHAWPLDDGGGRGRTLDRLRPCFELAAGWLAGLGAGGPPPPIGGPPSEPPPPAPVSADPDMARIQREAARGARGSIPILILGESGAGKEVMARFVHDGSPRAGGPFLAINCAALSSDLLEAELFGIERGVATGVEARPGLLERASGGTLFLDEVGDMPLPLQAKVLRVLEGASFYRVGGREAVRADVRFVAATHAALERKVEDGGFRADLFHRLAAFRIAVPPLRDRPGDLPLLASRFFHQALSERRAASPGITRGALGALARHDWPGNVRELKNEIARAVLLLEPGEPLDRHHLSERVRGGWEAEEEEEAPPPLSLACAVTRAERRAFRTALAAADGDGAKAMELLGLAKSTYYRKLKELDL